MTTLFRSKSCGGLPRPKASFFHYSNQQENDHDHDEEDDDNVCHFCQDYYINNNNSPITTPFISPCQQGSQNQSHNFTIISLVLTALRKSFLTCTIHDSEDDDGLSSLDIGCPTDVRHVSHVTFDRFNGFLGLPIAFQTDVPRKVPSARYCTPSPLC